MDQSGLPHEKELIGSIIHDDVKMFEKHMVEAGIDSNHLLPWLSRRAGVGGIHCLRMTPLMLAVIHGSICIIQYLLDLPGIKIDVQSEPDNLTALDCAFHYEIPISEHIKALLKSNGALDSTAEDTKRMIEENSEFLVHKFKMKPCSLSHCNPSSCSFVHPEDTMKRRDLCNFTYSASRCKQYPACSQECRLAHGDLESILHPLRFRTKYCKYGMQCVKFNCGYAHNALELRSSSQLNLISGPGSSSSSVPPSRPKLSAAAIPYTPVTPPVPSSALRDQNQPGGT